MITVLRVILTIFMVLFYIAGFSADDLKTSKYISAGFTITVLLMIAIKFL